jgi:UMF1 family MFS transporter
MNKLARVLKGIGLDRPELRAWAWYDWANSAMQTTIVAAVFPVYYQLVAAADLEPNVALHRFSIATTGSLVVVALLAPFLGAIADSLPVKKRLLGIFLAIGVTACAGMFFIGKGNWELALWLFVFADIGASASFIFYDSLLRYIAADDEIDRVSSAGYALGYLGGGTLLAVNIAWIQFPQWFGLPSGENLSSAQATLPTRLAFLSVAVWWLVFSIPLFRKVAEPTLESDERPASAAALFGSVFGRLKHTVTNLGHYKQAVLMLIAFLFYNDGIGTIIRLATIYGAAMKIEGSALIGSILIVQFVGVPFAFLFGSVGSKVGAKRAVLFGLLVYIGIAILGYYMTTALHFFLLAILVGMVQGGTQALSRSLFASMIPKRKSAEFFALFSLGEKFAGILGPFLFAMVLGQTGNSRHGILSVITFFVIGGVLLMFVDVEAGRRAVRSTEEVDGQPV